MFDFLFLLLVVVIGWLAIGAFFRLLGCFMVGWYSERKCQEDILRGWEMVSQGPMVPLWPIGLVVFSCTAVCVFIVYGFGSEDKAIWAQSMKIGKKLATKGKK